MSSASLQCISSQITSYVSGVERWRRSPQDIQTFFTNVDKTCITPLIAHMKTLIMRFERQIVDVLKVSKSDIIIGISHFTKLQIQKNMQVMATWALKISRGIHCLRMCHKPNSTALQSTMVNRITTFLNHRASFQIMATVSNRRGETKTMKSQMRQLQLKMNRSVTFETLNIRCPNASRAP